MDGINEHKDLNYRILMTVGSRLDTEALEQWKVLRMDLAIDDLFIAALS